ncbi:hypothetical protein [Streptomyces parvulus]|uniref:hypothetical protein n=1 Tax=Streptomyces parvulus TaxID=146923 RepID=UPI0033B4B6F1
MKIFGREPATILAFIALTLKLGAAYGLDVDAGQQALIMAFLACVVAVAEAFILKNGAVFAALVNFGHGAIALFMGFGLEMTAEAQALWMLLIEGGLALIVVRPQVTAPIAAMKLEQSSVVKAA